MLDHSPDPNAALRAYALDTPDSEPLFDVLVAQAAQVCGARAAFAGFLAPDREIVKSSFGWHVPEFSLEASFAARVRDSRDCVVIGNPAGDPRLSDHPLVVGPPHVRFFVGAPLRDENGLFLGCLSVIDGIPRVLAPQQVDMVRALASQIVRELALRRDRIALDEEVARLANMLEESEGKFRDFFEQTDDFVVSLAPDGTILHANEPLLQALGVETGELARTPLVRIVHPELRAELTAALRAAFEKKEPQHVESLFITSGGRRIMVEGMLRPRFFEGRPVLARVIFRDITDRKEIEVELGNARDAALEAARLKTQFLTNVSHEIRTPMNCIIGVLDLLMSSGMSAEQMDLAYPARASAEQLNIIVNNILSVSALEAGRLTSARLDFDLFRTLQRVVDVMRVAALGKDVEVRFDYADGLPPIVRGNRTRIAQVVTNLLENAVKFTHQGIVTLRVFLQTETVTHRVIRFEVRDTGIGISDEHRLLLFERFSQIDSVSTREYQGVGLGLAAARRLVETMGGLIDVESEPGAGSLFWFSIPFQKQMASTRPIASSELVLAGKRVVLADHLPTSRRIIRHYLEVTWEMRVDTADTGAEVLKLVRDGAAAGQPVGAVIFDELPDLSLHELARQIKAAPATERTAVILLAGMNASVDEEALRNAGVRACMTQPVGQGELFDALALAFAPDAAAQPNTTIRGDDSPRRLPVVTAEMRRGLHMLLAEDNFLNRKLTLSQLERLGYEADTVVNGKEAIEAARVGKFDVILMDCQMPIVDGYEATIEIRRAAKAGGVQPWIIALTANAREGDREKCLAAGMDDYLPKPTKHEDLSEALARSFAARADGPRTD